MLALAVLNAFVPSFPSPHTAAISTTPPGPQAPRLLSYELQSANDCPERDPAAWRLEAVRQEDYEAGGWGCEARHGRWAGSSNASLPAASKARRRVLLSKTHGTYPVKRTGRAGRMGMRAGG